jgi:enoyl-CoA hydratase/carnithine racemase
MTYATIRSEHSGAACIITLNRSEKRNAVSTQMMDEIVRAARAADGDPAVRAVVLTGGATFFSAGADLNEALQVKTAVEGVAYFEQWHRLNRTLEGLGKPVLAAIEGFCITGGLELALACDLRIAGEGSTFAITSSKIGTVAGAGGTQRLPRIVGMANALDICLPRIPSRGRGLSHRPHQSLVPKGQALPSARKWCRSTSSARR